MLICKAGKGWREVHTMKAEATKARKRVMKRKMRAQVGKLPTAYRNKISTHKK
jgi:hypothetical protein